MKRNIAASRSVFPQTRDRFATYLIQSFIDEDRTGRLYKAYDDPFQRFVCLKILSPELTRNDSFIDVLRIQLQAVSSANHPGIAEVYELSQSQDLHYIASEWCPGSWLSQEAATKGTWGLSETTDLMIQCAEILQTVSQKGIFHGNLRLNSILLYPEGQTKISEIGIVAAARALFGPKNLAVYLGTGRFLPPEMTADGPADFRADIYSLGLIFYFLLFGVIPFRYEGNPLNAPNDADDLENTQQVIKVISKMTERNPAKRYQDYSALLADLKDLRAISVTLLKPPSISKDLRETIQNQKLFKVLCALYASGASGALTVRQNGVQRTFYLRNREFVYFESDHPNENVWHWLVHKKELAEKHVPDATESFERAVNRVCAKGLLPVEDFKFRYQELTNRILSKVIKNASAEASFAPAEVKNEALASIRLADVLLKTARSSVDMSEVSSEIKPRTYLNRTGLFELLVPGFSLTQEETLLVSVSQDGIYTGSLETEGGVTEEKGLKFLYLLKQIGALSAGVSQASIVEPISTLTQEAPANDTEMRIESIQSEMGQPSAEPMRVGVLRTSGRVSVERLDQEADRRFELARQSYENGKHWEAANYCEMALALHEDSKYYWLMGLAYAQHPRFRSKAEDCFHRAIDLDPFNDELHVRLAEFYVAQGLPLRAKSHCFMALKIIPDQEQAKVILSSPEFQNLGTGGCCCEHEPGCNHDH